MLLSSIAMVIVGVIIGIVLTDAYHSRRQSVDEE
jgi:hypothetical protein